MLHKNSRLKFYLNTLEFLEFQVVAASAFTRVNAVTSVVTFQRSAITLQSSNAHLFSFPSRPTVLLHTGSLSHSPIAHWLSCPLALLPTGSLSHWRSAPLPLCPTASLSHCPSVPLPCSVFDFFPLYLYCSRQKKSGVQRVMSDPLGVHLQYTQSAVQRKLVCYGSLLTYGVETHPPPPRPLHIQSTSSFAEEWI
jgi:hypothetical protein